MPRTIASVRAIARYPLYSLEGDGSTGYATCGNNFNKEKTDPFSVAFWVKITATESYHGLISKTRGGAAYDGWQIDLASNYINFYLTSNAATSDLFLVFTEDPISQDIWHHIIVTYDGSGLASGSNFYVDGLLVNKIIALDALSGTISNSGNFVIGDYSYSPNNGALHGRIADVIIHGTELSSVEALKVFKNSFEPSLEEFVEGRWQWSEGSGAILSSSTGFANGDITTPVWSTDVPKQRQFITSVRSNLGAYRVPYSFIDLGVTNLWDFRTGYMNTDSKTVADVIGSRDLDWYGGTAIGSVYTTNEYSALLAAASSDYFRGPRGKPLGTLGQFSMIAFFRATTTGINQALFSLFDTVGNNRAFEFLFLSNNRLSLQLSSTGSSVTADYRATATTLSDTAVWHSYAFVFDGSGTPSITLYKDGAVIGSALNAGAIPATMYNSLAPLAIGTAFVATVPTDFANGKIGITAASSTTVWSADTILKLHNSINALGGYI